MARSDPGHFVVYLRWDVRRDWKRLDPEAAADPSLYPHAYGSNWRHFRAQVADGSTLWVVACPRYGRGATAYRFPPSLVARLATVSVTTGVRRRRPASPSHYAWVARAAKDESAYFPVNNALFPLTEVRFVDGRGRVSRLPRAGPADQAVTAPYAHIPQCLQSIRRVHPGDEAVLDRYARQLAARRTVFLSYSRREVARAGFDTGALADALRRRHFVPWLDIELLAQDAGGARFDDALLGRLLDDGLRQAALMVALTGPDYAASAWTAREWASATGHARGKGRLTVVQVPVGGRLMDTVGARLPAGSEDEVAEAIDRWWQGGRKGRP